MSKRKKLTQKRLKELLHYDPETGVFTWVVRKGKILPKAVAGGASSYPGYRKIMVDYVAYSAHRLAFLYMEGYFPEQQVDHLNGVRDDNRWFNLRHVSGTCNQQNSKTPTNSSSGFSGVSWEQDRKNWRVQAYLHNKRVFLGRYPAVLDAALARLTFEVQCPLWTCNHRGELIKAIKKVWPEFNIKSIE